MCQPREPRRLYASVCRASWWMLLPPSASAAPRSEGALPASPVGPDLDHLLERGPVLPGHAGHGDQAERLVPDPVRPLVRVPLCGVRAEGLHRGQEAPAERAPAPRSRAISASEHAVAASDALA